MENLIKKLSSTQVAIIVLVLLVTSLLAIFSFKLKLSPDFNASQVVEIQIDHEVGLDEATQVANTIQMPARIDKESTGKFYFFFQNVSTDNINSFISNFKSKQSGVLTATLFNYKPWGEIYLRERFAIIVTCGLLVFLTYSAWIMRKSGINRIELAQLLVSDLMSLAFAVIVLLGLGGNLGALGVIMSVSYWDLFLLGVIIIVIMKIYRLHRMRDILAVSKYTSLNDSYNLMYKKYWPELVFIFAFILLSSTLPWIVLPGRLAWAALLPALAAVIGVFNFFFVYPQLLRFLSELKLLDVKKLNRFNLNKKW